MNAALTSFQRHKRGIHAVWTGRRARRSGRSGSLDAGLAGCLYASSIRFISPDSFSGTQAVLLMTMLIVGGMGSIAGCIVGAVTLTILPEALRSLGQWYLVLYGLGVICVIVLAPGGLASVASIARLRWARPR